MINQFSPILTKEMGKLDFTKSADELDCLIRGFNPWPLTYFFYNERRFKLISAPKVCISGHKCGEYFEKDGQPFIACGEGTALKITEICPDGSKKMDSKAFINGRFITVGDTVNN